MIRDVKCFMTFSDDVYSTNNNTLLLFAPYVRTFVPIDSLIREIYIYEPTPGVPNAITFHPQSMIYAYVREKECVYEIHNTCGDDIELYFATERDIVFMTKSTGKPFSTSLRRLSTEPRTLNVPSWGIGTGAYLKQRTKKVEFANIEQRWVPKFHRLLIDDTSSSLADITILSQN